MRIRLTSPDGHYVAQLTTVALLNLYVPEDKRIDLYHEYDSTYLNHVVERNIAPTATSLQGILNDLAPRDKVLYLYVSAWAGNEPTHYIVLHKDTTTNLWKVTCRRILQCTPGQRPKKDGVLLTWASPHPHIAAGLRPSVRRIFSGSQHIQTLATVLQSNPDLQWEMHMCYLTHLLFSPKMDFSVWMQPTGKAVFRAISLPNNTEPCNSVYVNPYTFECIRTRPYAKNIAKPRCIIWAEHEIPEEFFEDGLHLVPQVKGTASLVFTEDKATLASILDMGLGSRLFPYIGLHDPATRRVTVYGLSYNPDNRRVETVVLTENRRPDTCANIPLIQPLSGGLYRPNYPLVDILLYHMFLFDVDDAERSNTMSIRWQGLRTLIRAFSGVSSTKRFPEVFEQWGMPLNEDQLAKLAVYAVRFP